MGKPLSENAPAMLKKKDIYKGPKFVGDLAKIQKSFTHPESVEDEEPKTQPLLTK